MLQKPPEAIGVGRYLDESEAGVCGNLPGIWCSGSCLEPWESLGHAGADSSEVSQEPGFIGAD